jgi:hypothetical protein
MHIPNLLILLIHGIIVFSTYFVEVYIAPRRRPESNLVMWIHIFSVILGLVFPVYAGWYFNTTPMFAAPLLGITTIGVLKMISFMHVMSDVRFAFSKKNYEGMEKDIAAEVAKYPACLTLSRYVYFLAAPTLCF